MPAENKSAFHGLQPPSRICRAFVNRRDASIARQGKQALSKPQQTSLTNCRAEATATHFLEVLRQTAEIQAACDTAAKQDDMADVMLQWLMPILLWAGGAAASQPLPCPTSESKSPTSMHCCHCTCSTVDSQIAAAIALNHHRLLCIQLFWQRHMLNDLTTVSWSCRYQQVSVGIQ